MFRLTIVHTVRTSVCPYVCVSVCRTCVLTVKAEVFGEGLGYKQLKALGDKVPDCPGIFIQTARGETLVSRVKEHKQLPPLGGKKREKEKQILGLNNASCHVDYKNKKTLLHNVIICRTNSTCFISCKSLRTLTACDRMCSRQ